MNSRSSSMSRRDLHAYGKPAGPAAEHVDHRLQVLRGVDAGELRRAEYVLAAALAPHRGYDLRDLLPGQMTTHPGLGALADLDLDRVAVLQRHVVEAVLVGDVLEDVPVRGDHLVPQGAPLPAAHGGPCDRAALGQGDLRPPRQRSEAHVTDVNWHLELHRPLRTLAYDSADGDLLPFVLGCPGELGAQEQDVVEIRNRDRGVHRTVDAPPCEGHLVDVVHDSAVVSLQVLGNIDSALRNRLRRFLGSLRNRRSPVIVHEHESGFGGMAERAHPVIGQVLEPHTLILFIVNLAANGASVACHGAHIGTRRYNGLGRPHGFSAIWTAT